MGFLETFFNLGVMGRVLPMLLAGFVNTLLLAVAVLVLGTALGVAICLGRLYGGPLLRGLAIGWIDLFRALPILVLLILIYYALPFAGIRLSGYASAVIALSLVFSAFTAEVLRAGIEAIPRGQVEAADALGVPRAVVIREIILPQALRVAIPAHTSNCVAIAKDTSLASVVAMPDLLKQATDAQALTANPSPLIAAALIYLAVLLPAVRLVAWLERRYAR